MKKDLKKTPFPRPEKTQKQVIAELRREVKALEKKIAKLTTDKKTMQAAFEESIEELQRVVTDESLEAIIKRVDRRIRKSKRTNRSGGNKL